jgi:hypothetical protein
MGMVQALTSTRDENMRLRTELQRATEVAKRAGGGLQDTLATARPHTARTTTAADNPVLYEQQRQWDTIPYK